jgi:hypothetical protein
MRGCQVLPAQPGVVVLAAGCDAAGHGEDEANGDGEWF